MRTILTLVAVALVAACAHGGRPETSSRAQARAAEDEARLAAALGGRVAGQPQDCVLERELGSNESYGRSGIVFRGSTDDVVYVNRPPAGCPGLDAARGMKLRTPAARLCRGDTVVAFDPVSGTELGGCSLGAFTPYRRAPVSAAARAGSASCWPPPRP